MAFVLDYHGENLQELVEALELYTGLDAELVDDPIPDYRIRVGTILVQMDETVRCEDMDGEEVLSMLRWLNNRYGMVSWYSYDEDEYDREEAEIAMEEGGKA